MLVVTDNTGSLDFRIARRRHWGGYHFPRHWYLFDAPSLRLLAGAAGLRGRGARHDDEPGQLGVLGAQRARRLGRVRVTSSTGSRSSRRSRSRPAPRSTPLHQLAGRGALLRAILRRPGMSRGEGPRRSSCSAPASPDSSPRSSSRASVTTSWSSRRATHVGGLATSHRVDGVSFDTGAHFVTNRLATALGVMDRCDDAARYGEAVWHRGRSAAYPLGLMRDPRFTAERGRGARSGAAGPAGSAADRFRAEYGRALADDVAIPLVEAWSGLPGDELAAERGRQDPRRHRRDPRAHRGPPPHPPRGRHRLLRRGAPERQRLARVPARRPRRVRRPARRRSSTAGSGSRRRRRRCVLDGDRVVGVRAGGEELDAAGVVSTLPAPVLPRLVDHPGVAPLARPAVPGDGVPPAARAAAATCSPSRSRGSPTARSTSSGSPRRRWRCRGSRRRARPCSPSTSAPRSATRSGTASEADLVARAEAGLLELIPDLRRRYLATYSTRTPIAYPVYARATETARRRGARARHRRARERGPQRGVRAPADGGRLLAHAAHDPRARAGDGRRQLVAG